MSIPNRHLIRVRHLEHHPQEIEKERVKQEKHNKAVEKLLNKPTVKGKK